MSATMQPPAAPASPAPPSPALQGATAGIPAQQGGGAQAQFAQHIKTTVENARQIIAVLVQMPGIDQNAAKQAAQMILQGFQMLGQAVQAATAGQQGQGQGQGAPPPMAPGPPAA